MASPGVNTAPDIAWHTLGLDSSPRLPGCALPGADGLAPLAAYRPSKGPGWGMRPLGGPAAGPVLPRKAGRRPFLGTTPLRPPDYTSPDTRGRLGQRAAGRGLGGRDGNSAVLPGPQSQHQSPARVPSRVSRAANAAPPRPQGQQSSNVGPGGDEKVHRENGKWGGRQHPSVSSSRHGPSG